MQIGISNGEARLEEEFRAGRGQRRKLFLQKRAAVNSDF